MSWSSSSTTAGGKCVVPSSVVPCRVVRHRRKAGHHVDFLSRHQDKRQSPGVLLFQHPIILCVVHLRERPKVSPGELVSNRIDG